MVCGTRSGKLTGLILAACIALASCADAPDTTRNSAVPPAEAEAELRRQARVMGKTILEGATAGGAVGGTIGFTIGGGDRDSTRQGANVGLALGATAGTYVAFVQRRFLRKEARLRRIKEDLDRNAAEMEATLAAMRQVLALQRAELAAFPAVSSEDPGRAAREVEEAEANLAQMRLAVSGAQARQEEFGAARLLTLEAEDTQSPIDPDLALLAERIGQMRAVANDLALALPQSAQ